MNKRQFLNELREELGYELPEGLVRSNVEYYSSYIDEEVRKGRSLDEVLTDLGDPRLIARTIVDAAKSGSDGIPNTSDDRDYSGQIYGGRQSYGGSSYDRQGYGSYSDEDAYGQDSASQSGMGQGQSRGDHGADLGSEPQRHRKNIHVSYYNFGCLGFFVLLFVLSFVFSVIGSAISFLMPLLGPLIIVFIILWLIKNMRGD